MIKSYAAGGAKYTLSIPRLDIRPGAKLAFVGESGSGKSTLLELLAMILRPDKSEQFSFRPDADRDNIDIGVAWQSGDADQLSDLRSKYVGYVLQSGGLLPYLTVRENINLSQQLLHQAPGQTAEELAVKLDIQQQLDKRPSMLSVGQRQRAAIARALAHQPRVVIADEPTAAIDPRNAERIMDLMAALADEMGVTLIVASHAISLVERAGLQLVKLNTETLEGDSMLVTVSDAKY
ncbi:MAG: ATP-binding cassette domain-containing protein [Xanthomonadales bacterium]|nr:ATP-binding cassette domain-containing protein [Xanthomonadales bacterium]